MTQATTPSESPSVDVARRRIPGVDVPASLLCFGNFTFGATWWSNASDDEAVAIQNQAVERGVNFFDTAPAYGNGRAEALLARTIQDVGRDDLVVSTKFGYDLKRDPGEEGSHRERKQDFSAAAIRGECENSLRVLGVERIDLYQAHNLKLGHCSDELFETLEALIAEGKIAAWGAALGPAIGWREEGRLSLARGAATVQTVYNLYEQDPGRELVEMAAGEHAIDHAHVPEAVRPAEAKPRPGAGVLARVPTNSGILDDEFDSPRHQFPPSDHRKFRDRNWLVYGLKKNDIVRPMAADLGLSLRQFAFKWLAGQPHVLSIEPNLICLDDVNDFAAAADAKPLPGDVLAELDRMYPVDFDLGDGAHPCDIKSSVAEGGAERSGGGAPRG
ncbi:MAG: aldo/keto reductase [Planctomycetota bacterium]